MHKYKGRQLWPTILLFWLFCIWVWKKICFWTLLLSQTWLQLMNDKAVLILTGKFFHEIQREKEARIKMWNKYIDRIQRKDNGFGHVPVITAVCVGGKVARAVFGYRLIIPGTNGSEQIRENINYDIQQTEVQRFLEFAKCSWSHIFEKWWHNMECLNFDTQIASGFLLEPHWRIGQLLLKNGGGNQMEKFERANCQVVNNQRIF